MTIGRSSTLPSGRPVAFSIAIGSSSTLFGWWRPVALTITVGASPTYSERRPITVAVRSSPTRSRWSASTISISRVIRIAPTCGVLSSGSSGIARICRQVTRRDIHGFCSSNATCWRLGRRFTAARSPSRRRVIFFLVINCR